MAGLPDAMAGLPGVAELSGRLPRAGLARWAAQPAEDRTDAPARAPAGGALRPKPASAFSAVARDSLGTGPAG